MLNINNNRGSILVMTMFALALVSTLIVGYLMIITTDLTIASNDAWSRQAEFAAEAGIAESLYQLSQNDNWSTGYSNEVLTTNQTFSVTVTNSKPLVTLVSTGSSNGFDKQIQVELSISGLNASGDYRLNLNTWEEQ